MTELPSGNVVAAGYVENYITNKTEGLIIKLDSNGCIDTLCNAGWIGTEETEKVSKIKIFPNPASEVLTINNPIGKHVEIFYIQGRLVRGGQVISTSQPVPIRGLPNGAYILKMQEKTLRVSYKIIKI